MKHVLSHPVLFSAIFLAFFSIEGFSSESGRFVLVSPDRQAVLCVAPSEPECVRLAVADLVEDVRKITGKTLRTTDRRESGSPMLVIGTFGIPESDAMLSPLKLENPTDFARRWECFKIKTIGPDCLAIVGSDPRGTMFGIYDFLEKQLGVDPFYFWKDRESEKRSEISFESLSVESDEPAFRYRGWFINDEDLLTKWVESGQKRHIDYLFYDQVIHPEVIDRVVEALVRNKFNMIIPSSFIDVLNPPEEALVERAARRGVFLSQHHIEPLGVSAYAYFNYWKAKDGTKPVFSFYSQREKILEVWNAYAERWARYPNVVWQIGLRGIGDRPMWLADPGVPQTDAERGKIISDALAEQLKIIKKHDRRENPPCTMTLWAEGARFFRDGLLTIPDEAIIVFSDNSPGWKFQDDFYTIERNEGKRYGVYYHHQLWGSGPHLVQGISPRWTWTVLKEAVERHSADYAVLNVSNVREFVLGLAASGQFMYDFKGFDPDRFTEHWMNENYPSKPKEVRALYDDYFTSFAVHPTIKTPLLLDGHLRSKGLSLLNRIKQYEQAKDLFHQAALRLSPKRLDVPTPHPVEAIRPADLTAKGRNADDGTNFGKLITDMGLQDAYPNVDAEDSMLRIVRAQRKAFEDVRRRCETLLPTLGEPEQRFLQCNLVAQTEIMVSLSAWYENLLTARILLAFDLADDAVRHLRSALHRLEGVDAARTILTRGEKWEHWYRGEDKMNLPNMIKRTKETLDLFE